MLLSAFSILFLSAAAAAASAVHGSAWNGRGKIKVTERHFIVGSSNKVFHILMNFMQIETFSAWGFELAVLATLLARLANGNAIDDRRIVKEEK